MKFMCMLITTLVISSAFFSSNSYAYNPQPLQDLCVAPKDHQTTVFKDGRICKDSKLATIDDFTYSGLNKILNPVHDLGISIGELDSTKIPGLNTLGMCVFRAELEPQGLVQFHIHPTGTEMIVILEGSLYVGFLAPDPHNILKSRLFSKTLNPGDVFVFPQELIHFQYNIGHTNASLLGFMNTQDFRMDTIPESIFASNPPTRDDILAKGFQLDKKVIQDLVKSFS